jgi:hypothetical protein
MFLISTQSKEDVSCAIKWEGHAWAFLGLMLTLGGVVGFDAAHRVALGSHRGAYLDAALGYLAIAALAWVWMVFNSLVDLRQRMRQAWSLVDIPLQRRHDLIPIQRHRHALQYPAGNRARSVRGVAWRDEAADTHGSQRFSARSGDGGVGRAGEASRGNRKRDSVGQRHVVSCSASETCRYR